MLKKTWIKPELIVLVRHTSDENLAVLVKCKHATPIQSFADTNSKGNNSNGSHSSCMRKQTGNGMEIALSKKPKYCEACEAYMSS